MYRLLLAVAILTAPASAVSTAQSSGEVQKPAAPTLTNGDVAHLVALHVSDQGVIRVIEESAARQFDLSEAALSILLQSGASSTVIEAMRKSVAPKSSANQPGRSTVVGPTLADLAAKTSGRPAAETPKRVFTNADLPREAPATPPLSAAEFSDIDRSKFDKVYAAGVAMRSSGYAAKRTPLALQAMLTFKTETAIAIDKAKTKGEIALAEKYAEAQWRFELELDPVLANTNEKWKAAFDKASALLDEADRIYLKKQ
jgi:hypothetical protein